MPQRRLTAPHAGARGEYLAQYLLSQIAQVVPVPRQEDFGQDFVCSLVRRSGSTEEQGRPFEVQVKTGGGARRMRLGGDGRAHEIVWLLNGRPLPLLLGVVDLRQASLDLYSVLPALKLASAPPLLVEFRLLVSRPKVKGIPASINFCQPQQRMPGGRLTGEFVVPIGPPMVRLKVGQDFDREQVVGVLHTWLEADDETRFYIRNRIPRTVSFAEWDTNTPPTGKSISAGSTLIPEELRPIEDKAFPLLELLRNSYSFQRMDEEVTAMDRVLQLLRQRGQHPDFVFNPWERPRSPDAGDEPEPSG